MFFLSRYERAFFELNEDSESSSSDITFTRLNKAF
ncbi:MAG: hypothetical protein Ta2E_11680 [Mycoplasmoidaceae bacterium]|nr:MAG: hypothetical protein Ta2E_11680 [Mycoplasmoidaceae bacterium]